jgi:hypothetical protein
MGFVERLGGVLPEPVRTRLRPVAGAVINRVLRLSLLLSRFQWAAKRRTLKHYGVSLRERPRQYLSYLLVDPELANFTYDLVNEDELAGWLASVTGEPRARVDELLAELKDDTEFERMVRGKLRRRRLNHKARPMFGRRAGWYVVARLRKPETIVETGIHDGLGSALLLRALERNAAEGSPGELISVDIEPAAGWVVPDELKTSWSRRIAPSPGVLPGAIGDRRVEMFIHDSDHTYECERAEMDIALARKGDGLALISDNSHATTALKDICKEMGIEYGLFMERPARHFYPGAGIGFGLVRQ